MSWALATAVLAVGAQSTVPVLERPNPGAIYNTFQAVVTYESRGEEDAANWDILGRTLLRGTRDYAAWELLLYGSQAGHMPVVSVMPGFIRIQMTSTPKFTETVAKMLTQMLISPSINDLTVGRSLEEAEAVGTNPFLDSLRMQELDYSNVTVESVKALWEHAFQPDSMKIYVSGRIEVGAVPETVRRQAREWEPPRPNPRTLLQAPVDLPTTTEQTGSYELRAEPLLPNSIFSSAKFLAVMALGVGKDCSMHRVLREEKGWSYLNEAVLYPTDQGWRPRMIMLRDGEEGPELLEAMRQALIEDVDSWDEQTLTRAIALGKMSLAGTLPWSPLWIDDRGPMTDSEFDQLAAFSYLDMLGAGAVDLRTWSMTLENVALSDLKDQAKEMLTKASGIYRPKS